MAQLQEEQQPRLDLSRTVDPEDYDAIVTRAAELRAAHTAAEALVKDADLRAAELRVAERNATAPLSIASRMTHNGAVGLARDAELRAAHAATTPPSITSRTMDLELPEDAVMRCNAAIALAHRIANGEDHDAGDAHHFIASRMAAQEPVKGECNDGHFERGWLPCEVVIRPAKGQEAAVALAVASGQPGSVAKLALMTSTAKAVCEKGHLLKRYTMSKHDSRECDECGRYFRAKTVSHQCRQCDYDLCSNCCRKTNRHHDAKNMPPPTSNDGEHVSGRKGTGEGVDAFKNAVANASEVIDDGDQDAVSAPSTPVTLWTEVLQVRARRAARREGVRGSDGDTEDENDENQDGEDEDDDAEGDDDDEEGSGKDVDGDIDDVSGEDDDGEEEDDSIIGSDSNSEVSVATGRWVCGTCTFAHTSGTSLECAVCLAPQPFQAEILPAEVEGHGDSIDDDTSSDDCMFCLVCVLHATIFFMPPLHPPPRQNAMVLRHAAAPH